MMTKSTVMLACVMVVGALLQEPTPAQAQQRGVVIPVDRPMWVLKRANIRSGPGTSYDKVGLMDTGQKVRATGEAGNWIRIQFANGRTAFIYAPLLSTTPPAGHSQATKPRTQIITYSNARYEGEVRNDNRHGQGTFTWKGTGEYAGREGRYEGGWRNDKHHGHGVKVWPNGDRYEGDFANGKSHGDGLWIAADGEYYLGQFRNGKRHGRGASFQIDGTRYDGEWLNGRAQGKVLITFSSGDIYGGMIRDHKPHGQGVLIFVNGNRYDGKWRNGCLLDGAQVSAATSAADCGFE